MSSIFIRLIVVTAIWCVSWNVFAGKLDDFEKSTTDDSGSSSDRSRSHKDSGYGRRHGSGRSDYHSSYDSDWDRVCFDSTVELIAQGLIYGGVSSLERQWGEGKPELKPRQTGEALIPIVRFDVSWQDVESDVMAWDYRGEIGIGFLGFQARQTFYDEKDPDETYEAVQLHGLYRMSFGNHVEVDFGFGSLMLRGDEKHNGFSFTLPVLLHFDDNFGLEYRPTWSTIKGTRIQDNDLSLMAGWRYVSIRGGYRWFYSDSESLNGPYVGMSFRW